MQPSSTSSTFNRAQAERLSSDVVYGVLDYLSLCDVIRAAHVCRRWRSVAFSHSTFSGTIVLESTLPAMLDRLQAQLSASHTRAISLRCDVTSDAGLLFSEVVAPLLRPHLARLKAADFHIKYWDAGPLFSLLSGDFPRLETLRVAVCPPVGREWAAFFDASGLPQDTWYNAFGVALSDEFLQGDVPRLTSFSGQNVYLPHSPPAALQNVRRVHLSSAEGATLKIHPDALVACFPAVKMLALSGTIYCSWNERWKLKNFPANLEELVVDQQAELSLVFRHLAFAERVRVPRIVAKEAHPSVVELLLAHLGPRLRVRLTERAAEVIDLDTGTTREFLQDYTTPERDLARQETGLLSINIDRWANRVEELSLSYAVWEKFFQGTCYTADFPSMKRLVVLSTAGDNYAAHSPRATRLRCHALEQITFTAAPGTQPVIRISEIHCLIQCCIVTNEPTVVQVDQGIALGSRLEPLRKPVQFTVAKNRGYFVEEFVIL